MRYPFSPEFLDALPEELAELFRELEAFMLGEICDRLKLSEKLNACCALTASIWKPLKRPLLRPLK